MEHQALAPIVVFVYNRPEHTQRTIESLAKNALAKDSILYIFSDAAKNRQAEEGVKKVRNYIDLLIKEDYFKEVHIVKAQHNKGLATSIITGVDQVIEKNKKVIVLEDDLLSAPDFLSFMNEALDYYYDNDKIGSISGYSPIASLPKQYQKDVWTACRSSSLGWGTWFNRWKEVDWDVKDFHHFQKDRYQIRQFNRCGSDQYDRLHRQMNEGADSWAVRFSYWQFRAKKLTVFPARTRIQHIGWDGSGVHGTYSGPLDTHITHEPTPFILENVEPNQKIIQELYKLYSGSFSTQLARYLRSNGFERVEQFLRRVLGK